MEGESTDSEQDNHSHPGAGVDGPGWDDNGILKDLATGSVAMSAHGGGGASCVSAASVARVPSIIGGGILVSTAQSVIATGNYFDETARPSCHVTSAQKVVCPNDKHRAQRLHDYCWHQAATTAALPDLFGMAKHFHTKNADGELSYKYKDIQSEYVRNLNKLKFFGNAWKRLTCLNHSSFLSGSTPMPFTSMIVGGTGRVNVLA